MVKDERLPLMRSDMRENFEICTKVVGVIHFQY